VHGAGLDHAPFADVPAEIIGPVAGRLPTLSFDEANRTVIAEIFGRLDAQAALPGITRTIDEWHPDVVVREPCEFASVVAAERAGLPQVQVAIGMASVDDYFMSALADPLAELSVLAGLPADAAALALKRSPGLSTVPPELDGVDHPMVRRFRDPAVTTADGRIPAPWGDAGDPLVYVSFGSVTASLGPFAELYRGALAALADMRVRVMMTTGGAHGALDLGLLPANVHVERFWPQAEVMPHAAIVVGHGGFGTTMLSFAAGVPQVVVPLFAFDQHVNADRVAAVGAGIHLADGLKQPQTIGNAVLLLLDTPSFGVAAVRIAGQIAALPDVAGAVPVLAAVAAGDDDW
jgi:glycosyltransferase